MTFLLVGVYLLTLTEDMDFESLVFEAASALGTVGLSTGVTPLLSDLGKLSVTLLMFIGRLGRLEIEAVCQVDLCVVYQAQFFECPGFGVEVR